MGALSSLRKVDQTVVLGQFGVDSGWTEAVYAPYDAVEFETARGRLQPLPTNEGHFRAIRNLTEIDLIEEATNIFIFMTTIGRQGTGHEYLDWLTKGRSSSYSKGFRILTEVFGAESAYIALPVLVLWAFRTTTPLAAFPVFVQLTCDSRLRPARMGTPKYACISIRCCKAGCRWPVPIHTVDAKNLRIPLSWTTRSTGRWWQGLRRIPYLSWRKHFLTRSSIASNQSF